MPLTTALCTNSQDTILWEKLSKSSPLNEHPVDPLKYAPWPGLAKFHFRRDEIYVNFSMLLLIMYDKGAAIYPAHLKGITRKDTIYPIIKV